MTTSIYQIQYSDNVVGKFDPDFKKYDCRGYPENEKREIAHMQRFFKDGVWKNDSSQLFGLFSPKFNEKSNLAGSEVIDWIHDNPGYDVYFINPFPEFQYFYFNIWEQGKLWHPDLLELADSLFNLAGLDIQTKNLPRNSSDTLLFSNYWVGNEKFWQSYMSFVQKLTDALNNMDTNDKNKFFELAPHDTSATYFPFIFERLFSTFLVLNRDFTSLSYHYERNEIYNRCNSDLERFIVDEYADIMEAWDAKGRDDLEYRDMFDKIQAVLTEYNTNMSNVGDPDYHDASENLIKELKHSISSVRL